MKKKFLKQSMKISCMWTFKQMKRSKKKRNVQVGDIVLHRRDETAAGQTHMHACFIEAHESPGGMVLSSDTEYELPEGKPPMVGT
jgi:hypothetical protein